MTNGEKVRAMDNEELGLFIAMHRITAPNCLGHGDKGCPCKCSVCWHEWLDEEEDDEDD